MMLISKFVFALFREGQTKILKLSTDQDCPVAHLFVLVFEHTICEYNRNSHSQEYSGSHNSFQPSPRRLSLQQFFPDYPLPVTSITTELVLGSPIWDFIGFIRYTFLVVVLGGLLLFLMLLSSLIFLE